MLSNMRAEKHAEKWHEKGTLHMHIQTHTLTHSCTHWHALTQTQVWSGLQADSWYTPHPLSPSPRETLHHCTTSCPSWV